MGRMEEISVRIILNNPLLEFLSFFLAEYFGRLVGTIDDFELIERSAYEW
jgi:hypothetical protein